MEQRSAAPPLPAGPWRPPALVGVEPEPEPEVVFAPSPKVRDVGGRSDGSDDEEWSDDEGGDGGSGGAGGGEGEDEEDFSDEGDDFGGSDDEDYGDESGSGDEDGEEERAFMVNQEADGVVGKVFKRNELPTVEWRPAHLRLSLFAEGPAVCAFGFCMAEAEELPDGLFPCPEDLVSTRRNPPPQRDPQGLV